MTMHPQAKAFLDFTAANNPIPADATLEERRADAADYLKYAGPLSDDVHTEHTYFTSPTADLHAVIYRPKNVKPNAPALVYFHGGGWVFSWTLRICRLYESRYKHSQYDLHVQESETKRCTC